MERAPSLTRQNILSPHTEGEDDAERLTRETLSSEGVRIFSIDGHAVQLERNTYIFCVFFFLRLLLQTC